MYICMCMLCLVFLCFGVEERLHVVRTPELKLIINQSINQPHTRTYPYEVSATKRSSLQTSSALSFILYACRTILGGIVTDIQGHRRHT